MKILVTGGAGFIGSHIVDAYIADGHDVTVVDDLSTGKKENINPAARFIPMDIRDNAIGSVLKDGDFDIISHHAAQIDVRVSVQEPLKDAQINVLGLINLLEHARKYSIRKIVFSASGGTYYGEAGKRSPIETDRPHPLSPYGINKLVSEYYLAYYASVFDLKYTILRYGNVYGPRQDPHGEAGVVAIFCGRILNNEEVFIFGDGKQMRDYVFVEDVVAANRKALSRGANDVFNIGTGFSASVLELVALLKQISRKEITVTFKPARPGELFKSALQVAKAAKILKWKTRYTLAKGLQRTYEYFRDRSTP